MGVLTLSMDGKGKICFCRTPFHIHFIASLVSIQKISIEIYATHAALNAVPLHSNGISPSMCLPQTAQIGGKED